jgi:hypothetical protein
MSSGIEILILAPLLIPGVFGSAATVAVGTGGAAVGGGVAVTGSSIATTGAFATGSIGAAGGTAATGAAVAGGAVMVFGAAAAALLAARHIHTTYQAALSEYNQRLDDEYAEGRQATEAGRLATDGALQLVRKTQVQAAEAADVAFLRAGVKRLQKRVEGWPDVDPHLPGACTALLTDLERDQPNLTELFAAYEALNTRVGAVAEKQQARLKACLRGEQLVAAQRAAVAAEVVVARSQIGEASTEILADAVRADLNRLLGQVEHLLGTQPVMAEQGLKLLFARISRELTLGAERAAHKRSEQERVSKRLRELAGQISARSQATLSVLDNDELSSYMVAKTRIAALRGAAMTNLERLSKLVSSQLPSDLAPLEKLAHEADALAAKTADELRQIALQTYLESQISEVFTLLGYRVTTVEEPAAYGSSFVAAFDSQRGVEVRVDGQGNMQSELVALSPAGSEVEEDVQEKVCLLMDDVFELLRARGCGVREKKRRHSKKGGAPLRVVKVRNKTDDHYAPTTAPIERRLG